MIKEEDGVINWGGITMLLALKKSACTWLIVEGKLSGEEDK